MDILSNGIVKSTGVVGKGAIKANSNAKISLSVDTEASLPGNSNKSTIQDILAVDIPKKNQVDKIDKDVAKATDQIASVVDILNNLTTDDIDNETIAKWQDAISQAQENLKASDDYDKQIALQGHADLLQAMTDKLDSLKEDTSVTNSNNVLLNTILDNVTVAVDAQKDAFEALHPTREADVSIQQQLATISNALDTKGPGNNNQLAQNVYNMLDNVVSDLNSLSTFSNAHVAPISVALDAQKELLSDYVSTKKVNLEAKKASLKDLADDLAVITTSLKTPDRSIYTDEATLAKDNANAVSKVLQQAAMNTGHAGTFTVAKMLEPAKTQEHLTKLVDAIQGGKVSINMTSTTEQIYSYAHASYNKIVANVDERLFFNMDKDTANYTPKAIKMGPKVALGKTLNTQA